jgi:hypothetical protein
MACDTGTNLREHLQQLEFELNVARKNYQCTGLPRYKQTFAESQQQLSVVRLKLEQHEQVCSSCKVTLSFST